MSLLRQKKKNDEGRLLSCEEKTAKHAEHRKCSRKIFTAIMPAL